MCVIQRPADAAEAKFTLRVLEPRPVSAAVSAPCLARGLAEAARSSCTRNCATFVPWVELIAGHFGSSWWTLRAILGTKRVDQRSVGFSMEN